MAEAYDKLYDADEALRRLYPDAASPEDAAEFLNVRRALRACLAALDPVDKKLAKLDAEGGGVLLIKPDDKRTVSDERRRIVLRHVFQFWREIRAGAEIHLPLGDLEAQRSPRRFYQRGGRLRHRAVFAPERGYDRQGVWVLHADHRRGLCGVRSPLQTATGDEQTVKWVALSFSRGNIPLRRDLARLPRSRHGARRHPV